jgi:hypothetical protein
VDPIVRQRYYRILALGFLPLLVNILIYLLWIPVPPEKP